jgi:hypothetical protein
MHSVDYIKSATEEGLKEAFLDLTISSKKEHRIISISINKKGEWVLWFYISDAVSEVRKKIRGN